MTLFDPLDREIFERALEAAHAALKTNLPSDALDSDEALEQALRRELIDIALTAGISDAETFAILPYRHLNKVVLHLRAIRLWRLAQLLTLPYWKQSPWGC